MSSKISETNEGAFLRLRATDADGNLEVAIKYDRGKLPFDLIPPEALCALAEVLRFGAQKYARRNWELGGLTWDQLFAAAQRHLWAFHGGEDTDPESGLSHLGHALCCIAFAVALRERGKLDR